VAEAHAPNREMFGFPRLAQIGRESCSGETLINRLLAELAGFTGPGWEQEDDITLVTLQRLGGSSAPRLLDEFEVSSEPGQERVAMARVTAAVQHLLPAARLDQLGTAVAEAVMNAAEHGNRHRADLPVTVTVAASIDRLEVTVTDLGSDTPIPDAGRPDLAAKLAGQQDTRGWGLFLIRNMVDELRTTATDGCHAVRLIMHLDSAAEAERTAVDGNY
jgi:anti-sigma regulatory factor (Ser/Thr protein kinase)